MGYKVTNLKFSVHPEGDSPFSEFSTYVHVEDEGGGAFLVLRQDESVHGVGGEVRLTLEEVEVILNEGKNLVGTHGATG